MATEPLKGAGRQLQLIGDKRYSRLKPQAGDSYGTRQSTFGTNLGSDPRNEAINKTPAQQLQEMFPDISEDMLVSNPYAVASRIHQYMQRTQPIEVQKTGLLWPTPRDRQTRVAAEQDRFNQIFDMVGKQSDSIRASRIEAARDEREYGQTLERDVRQQQLAIEQASAIDEAKRRATERPMLNAATRRNTPGVAPSSPEELAQQQIEDMLYEEMLAKGQAGQLDITGKSLANQLAERNLGQAQVYPSAAGPTLQDREGNIDFYPMTPSVRTPGSIEPDYSALQHDPNAPPIVTPPSVTAPSVSPSPQRLRGAGGASQTQQAQPQAANIQNEQALAMDKIQRIQQEQSTPDVKQRKIEAVRQMYQQRTGQQLQ